MKLSYDLGKQLKVKNMFADPSFNRLKGSLLSIMIRSKDLLFRSGSNPDQVPWQPLSPVTIAAREYRHSKTLKANRKRKGQAAKGSSGDHQILKDTGVLRNSITIPGRGINSTEGPEVVLGTNVPYAHLQNFGGTITTDRSPFGVKLSEPRTYTIPPRPFMGFGKQDNKNVTQKIIAWMDKFSGWTS